MARFQRGRKSKRDEIAAKNAAFRYLGMPEFQTALPKARAPRKPSGKPLERNILAAIVKALKKHPKVERVQRNTSGVFMVGDRVIRVGSKGMPDLTIFMKDGRWGYIEVKTPTGVLTPEQTKVLANSYNSAAFARVAHSVDEALAIIDAA